MMAAENSAGEVELTNQQKFHNFRRKTIIEVRLISHTGAPEKWHEAVIKDTNKEGAYCQLLNSPGQRFWHWRDVRPCARTEMPRVSAPLGQIAMLHKELEQATELPRRTPLPAPPALVAALAPVAPISPPAPLVRFARPEPPAHVAAPPGPVRPFQNGTRPIINAQESELGEMIRGARYTLRLPQKELAQTMAVRGKVPGAPDHYNKLLSRYELGQGSPNDDELLLLADALQLDLDRLIAARDRDRVAFEERKKLDRKRKNDREYAAARRQEKKAAAEGREVAHRRSPYREAPSVARKPVAASPQRFEALEDLIEALIAIVPMPSESEQRRTWFRCARELFEIAGS